jgi:hypothetical protein
MVTSSMPSISPATPRISRAAVHLPQGRNLPIVTRHVPGSIQLSIQKCRPFARCLILGFGALGLRNPPHLALQPTDEHSR